MAHKKLFAVDKYYTVTLFFLNGAVPCPHFVLLF